MDLVTRVFELYRQVQKLQDRLEDLETRGENDSNDTENLIKEEVHWIIKVLRKNTLFFYSN